LIELCNSQCKKTRVCSDSFSRKKCIKNSISARKHCMRHASQKRGLQGDFSDVVFLKQKVLVLSYTYKNIIKRNEFFKGNYTNLYQFLLLANDVDTAASMPKQTPPELSINQNLSSFLILRSNLCELQGHHLSSWSSMRPGPTCSFIRAICRFFYLQHKDTSNLTYNSCSFLSV
jgi:hypothetical protein